MNQIFLSVAVIFVLSACGSDKSSPKSLSGPSTAAPQPELNEVPIPQGRRADLVTVTPVYGPLAVRVGRYDAKAKQIPWSSWWYPVMETTLFQQNGGLSPLEKYDLYASQVHGKQTHAAQYERDHNYDPNAVAWAGLCDAWSAASILSPEPTHPVTLSGITFTVADLKALSLKTYEDVDGESEFGQRFDGQRGDDFDDIYPDQFHKLLQAELIEKGTTLVFDKDPGVAVWNQPLFGAEFNITADPSDPKVLHVNTWLTWADDVTATPNTVGTIAVNSEYTYDLFGHHQPDGSFKVVYGEWTGHSLDDHPDFVTLMPAPGGLHKSRNPEIDTRIVEEILAQEQNGHTPFFSFAPISIDSLLTEELSRVTNW